MAQEPDLTAIIARLDGSSADALESDRLEFKSWEPAPGDRRRRVRALRESVVAMANASGGTIVLGVADRKTTRAEAIHGVGDLDGDVLRRDIYDGTDPHILVDLESLDAPEGRLLVLRVPRGIPPHTTTDGVARIRIGKDSKPLTGSHLALLASTRAGLDPTAQLMGDAEFADLDSAQLGRLREEIVSNGSDSGLARLSDRRLLEALGLAAGSDLTLAAILLLGKPAALARFAPTHDFIFVRRADDTRYEARRDFRAPLLQTLDDAAELIRNHTGLTTVSVSGFRDLEIPDVGPWVAREAILNAVTHRDYFPRQSVLVSLYPDRLEVTSPGGFPGGVTAENVIRHPPVRRNSLLANVFRDIGLVDRVGQGVDRIYTELLRAGKPRPYYGGASDFVRLTLPTRTDPEVAQFLDSEDRRGTRFGLDDLLVFDALRETEEIDRWSAARVLQTDDAEAARRLVSLRRGGHLVPHGRGRGTRYRLAETLRSVFARTLFERSAAGEDERRRVLSALAQGERLTNAQVRRLIAGSRNDALMMMRTLRREGLAAMEGTRGGAYYIAGPQITVEPGALSRSEKPRPA